MIEADLPLSPDGQRRREEIGRLARLLARRRRQRRVAGRGVLITLLISAIGGGWWLSEWSRAPLSARHIVVVPPSPLVPQPAPISPAAARVVIDRIVTDATITARLSIGRTTPRWRMIGDDELLRTLADAGHPAGLIRMNGQEILMTR